MTSTIESPPRVRTPGEVDARRLKMVVYPALFAFMLLSSYGFYLIWSLTQDIHHLTMEISSLNKLANNNVGHMATDLNHISQRMDTIDQTMKPIADSMSSMNWSTAAMAANTHAMQRDMRGLNHSMTTPMSMMPWNFFGFGQ